MSHSLTTPLVKVVGDDALLTCVVQNQQNYTLMWKKDSKEKVFILINVVNDCYFFVLQIGTKILTANTERVTGDPRVSIIHEEGGEVRPVMIMMMMIMMMMLSGVCPPDQECEPQGCRYVHL